MYKLLLKHGQLAAFALGLLVIIIFGLSVSSGLDGFNALSDEDQATTTIFDIGLKLTIVLLVICAAAAVLFAIYQMVTNPKGALKGIIALVVIAVLFFILYSSASVETSGPIANAIEKFEASSGGDFTDSNSKMVSAGIKSTLILGAIAVAAFVISEIRNLFK